VVVEIEVLIELASLDTLYDWNGRGGLPGQLHRYAIAIASPPLPSFAGSVGVRWPAAA
jgi:hypothetical protein